MCSTRSFAGYDLSSGNPKTNPKLQENLISKCKNQSEMRDHTRPSFVPRLAAFATCRTCLFLFLAYNSNRLNFSHILEDAMAVRRTL